MLSGSAVLAPARLTADSEGASEAVPAAADPEDSAEAQAVDPVAEVAQVEVEAGAEAAAVEAAEGAAVIRTAGAVLIMDSSPASVTGVGRSRLIPAQFSSRSKTRP